MTFAGIAAAGPTLQGPAWVFPASDPSAPASTRFVPQAGVAVDDQRVYAISLPGSGQPARLWAIGVHDGRSVWSAPIPSPVLESWSPPVLDLRRGAVYVAIGAPGLAATGRLIALDSATGLERWRATLAKDIVNAAPALAEGRVFITDYEGFYAGGEGGSLYAIDATTGAIDWTHPTFAALSGATPAVAGDRVVIATAGDAQLGNGRVLCFDARASDGPSAMLWGTEIPGDDAFFGGVTIAGDAVYAATYDFFGGRNASRLVKLDLHTGALLWQAPCDRSASRPIVLPRGRVLLSVGIPGFGSVPSLQMFTDLGAEAARLWDTAADTWADDGDGAIEPGEFTRIGGWTQQPALASARFAVVGSLTADGTSDAYDQLRVLDLESSPAGPGFVRDLVPGAGASPALRRGVVFTIGAAGLHAFTLEGITAKPSRAGDDTRLDKLRALGLLPPPSTGLRERKPTEDSP